MPARIMPSVRSKWPTPAQVSKYQAGADHIQHSLDAWGNATAVANGRALVAQVTDAENQHIMGFGALNPEVTAGNRDYVASGFHDRVTGVMAGADTKIITFAVAPPWMRETPAGVTPVDDYTPTAWFTAPPLAANVAAFANLCANVASTYTSVTYFQVWNEMKGMFRDDLGRWDYARYTTLYNAVWAAVKAVRPDAKIGGPYVSLTHNQGPGSPVQDPSWGWVDQRSLDVVTYWLANKTGADFVTIDGGNNLSAAVPFGTFASFMTWLRGLDNVAYPGARDLPVWIAEHYCYPPGASDVANSTDAPRYPPEWAVGTIEAIRAGYSTVLMWGPQGADGDTALGLLAPMAFVTDTNVVGGGQATALHPVAKALHDNYSAGAAIYIPATGNANIVAVANGTVATLINRVNSSQSTSGFTPAQTLTAYEVRTVRWAATGYVQQSVPAPGPLWIDDFTATTKLLSLRGAVGVTGGRLRAGATGADYMATSSAVYDTADHFSETVVATLTGGSFAGVGLRFDTVGTRYYALMLADTGTATIYYFNGTAYTTLASAAVTVGTLPGTLRGEVQGTALRLFWRGSLVVSTTHSTLTTGKPSTYLWATGTVGNAELESWQASPL